MQLVSFVGSWTTWSASWWYCLWLTSEALSYPFFLAPFWLSRLHRDCTWCTTTERGDPSTCSISFDRWRWGKSWGLGLRWSSATQHSARFHWSQPLSSCLRTALNWSGCSSTQKMSKFDVLLDLKGSDSCSEQQLWLDLTRRKWATLESKRQTCLVGTCSSLTFA